MFHHKRENTLYFLRDCRIYRCKNLQLLIRFSCQFSNIGSCRRWYLHIILHNLHIIRYRHILMALKTNPAAVKLSRPAFPCKISQGKIRFLPIFCHSMGTADIMPYTQQKIININHLHFRKLLLISRKPSRNRHKLCIILNQIVFLNQFHQCPDQPLSIHFQIQILICVILHFPNNGSIILSHSPIKFFNNHRIPKTYVIAVQIRITVPEP